MSWLLRRACDHCSRRKVKCDGLQPCQNCTQRELACNFSNSSRKAPVAIENVAPGSAGPSFSVISEFKVSRPSLGGGTRPGRNADTMAFAAPTTALAPALSCRPSQRVDLPVDHEQRKLAYLSRAVTVLERISNDLSEPQGPANAVPKIIKDLQVQFATGSLDSVSIYYGRLYVQLGVAGHLYSPVIEGSHDENVADFSRLDAEPLGIVIPVERAAEISSHMYTWPVLTELIVDYFQLFCPDPRVDALTDRFLEAVRDQRVSPMLTNAVLGYTARRSRNPNIYLNPPYEMSRLYYDQAQLLSLEALEVFSIDTLLAYVTMEVVAVLTVNADGGFMYNDLSIRLCMSLNLHHTDLSQSSNTKSLTSGLAEEEVDYRRQLFWETLFAHYYRSMSRFNPVVLSLEDCAVKVPTTAYRIADSSALSDTNLSESSLTLGANRSGGLEALTPSAADITFSGTVESPTQPTSGIRPSSQPASSSSTHTTPEQTWSGVYLPTYITPLLALPFDFNVIPLLERFTILNHRKSMGDRLTLAELQSADAALLVWYAQCCAVFPLPPLDPACLPLLDRASATSLSPQLDRHCLYYTMRSFLFREGPEHPMTHTFADSETVAFARAQHLAILRQFDSQLLPCLERIPASVQTIMMNDAVFNLGNCGIIEYLQNRDTKEEARAFIVRCNGWLRNAGFYAGHCRFITYPLRMGFPLSAEQMTHLDAILC
ncbi:hypothetical protein IWQ60_004779 [Tieghemiomyces parasiticus]|uniref:Zn(2)-C6 fungal-type domain-containing protein n=1 Tax=Tieghemiomyces parasiticus TaxID=78921 RepID=A0A9W8AAC3_9FUNG|nr:hypothetical protein IWQ60_004779 [Tieghemiomyces parasiticus]